MVSSFSVDDSLKKKSPSERMFALADMSEKLDLMGLISIAVFLLSFFICMTLTKNKGVEICLLYSFLSGFIGIIFFMMLHILAINYAVSLRSYGLRKNQTIWLIDFKNKHTVLAKIVGLKVRGRNFDETCFSCAVDGDVFSVLGDDLFGSEEAAAAVLKYVTDVNDLVLSKYYPGWRTDSRFKVFYNLKFIRRFGFGRVSTIPFTYAVTFPVMINEKMYIPAFSIHDLFDEFYDKIEHEEVEVKDEREGIIIRRVNALKSPFCP